MSVTGKPAQIMDALFARAALLETTGPKLPIAWPERPFDVAERAPDGKYLIVSYFPNRPAWEGLASGRLDQGLLQVSVVWPKGEGEVAANQVAAEVMSHFPKGLPLVSGATRVKITAEPWAGQAISGPDKLLVPVTVSWTA